MRLQMIQDSDGKPTGVFIPINEWEKLKRQYKDLKTLEEQGPTKEDLLKELREAIAQLKAIKQGNLNARPAKELLNEL